MQDHASEWGVTVNGNSNQCAMTPAIRTWCKETDSTSFYCDLVVPCVPLGRQRLLLFVCNKFDFGIAAFPMCHQRPQASEGVPKVGRFIRN